MIQKKFTRIVNFLISDDELSEVDRIASEQSVSRGQVIRESLRNMIRSCNNTNKGVNQND